MRNYLYLLLAILLVSSQAFAQNEPAFKVLAAKGNCNLKNGTEVKPLKAGVSIPASAVVEIGANSLLGLMYKNGRTIEVKDAGSFPVSDLIKQAITKTNSSVTSQYTKYVMAQVTKQGDDPVSASPGKYMAVTGAVMRSAPGGKPIHIKLLTPQTEILADGATSLHWTTVQSKIKAPAYELLIMNTENEVLLKKEVEDTTAVVDFASIPAAKGENLVLLRVESKDRRQISPTIPLYVSKVEPDVRTEYKDLIASMDKKSATDWIGAAFFCERNNLNADAYHCYRKALQIAPQVKEYQDAYQNFLKMTKMQE